MAMNRRSFSLFSVLLALAVASIAAFGAQLPKVLPAWIPVWQGTRYVYATLGSHLTFSNGVLDVVVSPAPTTSRIYGADIVPNNGVYLLPPGATKVVVYVNGLRSKSGVDYVLENNAVKPLWTWGPDFQVVFDYDTWTASSSQN